MLITNMYRNEGRETIL